MSSNKTNSNRTSSNKESENKTSSNEKSLNKMSSNKTTSNETSNKLKFLDRFKYFLNKYDRPINYIIGIIMPLAILFLSEYIQRQSFSKTLEWTFGNIGFVLLNFLIMYGLFNLVQLIFNKTTISCLTTSLVYFGFSIVSYLKYEIRGDVLIINDFALAGQAGGLLEFIEPQMLLKLPIILSILFLVFSIILFAVHKIKTKRKNTLIKLVSILIAGYILFVNSYTSASTLRLFGLDKDIRYNMNSVYEKEGIALALYSNIVMSNVEIPEGYSKEKIFETLDLVKNALNNSNISETTKENLENERDSLNNSNNPESSKENQENEEDLLNNSNVQESNEDNNKETFTSDSEKIKPNVIMIMSESFFDPTVLEGVNFSQDPIPNVRKLMNNYTSGRFISSTFAGGTSNIEFEAFTGNSIAYMPYGAVPYTDIKDKIANAYSLPKIMKDNGYKAIALHTYDKTFYDRDINYENLGFDEFIGVDELYEPKYFGKYVSDETFTDNIIKIIEDNQTSDNTEKDDLSREFEGIEKNNSSSIKNIEGNNNLSNDVESGDTISTSKNSNQPLFIWGVTMQNHTPYTMSNYSEDEIKISLEGENLSEEAIDKLSAYTNGIYESDRAIQKLVDYLEESETPTVLLFFGDHLPSQYSAYFDTGLIHTKDTTKWNAEEMLELHTIPFFIYDNYNLKTEYSNDETVGAVFLGNYLCNYINVEKPIYFKFLDTLTFKAIRDRLFVDKDCQPHDKVIDEYKEQVEAHKLLQYDIIYGEHYIFEYKK